MSASQKSKADFRVVRYNPGFSFCSEVHSFADDFVHPVAGIKVKNPVAEISPSRSKV